MLSHSCPSSLHSLRSKLSAFPPPSTLYSFPYTKLFLKIDISSTLYGCPPFPHLISPLQHMPCIRFKLPPIRSPHKFLIPSFSISAKSLPSSGLPRRKHNAHHCHRNEKALWPIIAASFFNPAIARRKNHSGDILPPIFLP